MEKYILCLLSVFCVLECCFSNAFITNIILPVLHQHLWDWRHNSHHQQISISNRIYLTHNVMAEKIQCGLCMPEGLVRTASGKMFSACEPRMLLGKKKSPTSVFYSYFSEYKRTMSNLVDTFHCSGADMRNPSCSRHEAASAVNTVCHPDTADTYYSF